MTNNYSYQDNYKPVSDGMQLLLPLEVGFALPEDDPARYVSAFVDNLSYEEVFGTSELKRAKPIYPEILLLKICLLASVLSRTSSRNIEELCRYDLRFIWLLQGYRAPDHTTIWRFKKKFAPQLPVILKSFCIYLYKKGFITEKEVFIDGTKIESAAGRYTFVWKKAVIKYLEKLLIKLPEVLEETQKELDTDEVYVSLEDPQELLLSLIEKVKREISIQGIKIVSGKGKRKHQLQKLLETIEGSFL